jgi:hypothetical protein
MERDGDIRPPKGELLGAVDHSKRRYVELFC